MIKVYQEGNKLTLKIHDSIDKTSWFEDGEKEEDAVANVSDLEKILSNNKNASIIDIYINSAGGDVFEGIGIYNILKRNKAYKRVYVDGFACSIASVIAMAGNQICMPKSSMMMIHNCWTMVCGNANDLRKMASDLDKMNALSIKAYMTKFNGTEKELQNLLDGETYLSAEECLEKGLCTKIIEDGEETEAMVNDALDKNTNMYNAKLEQLRAIKESIKQLDAEVEKVETVKEAKEVETIKETETIKEADDEMNDLDETKTYTKEEVKEAVESVQQNALQRFFHIQVKEND